MVKRKHAAALFEVISKGKEAQKGGMHVPGWAGKVLPHAQPAAPPPEPVAPEAVQPLGTAAPPLPSRPAVPLVQPPRREPAMADADVQPAEPLVQVSGGRLKLSLNYVSCGVVCLAVALVFLLGYVLGHSSGSKQATGTPMSLGGPNPAPTPVQRDDVFDRLQAQDSQRTAGKWYLTVQSNVESLDDAKAIQRFLDSKTIATTIWSAGSTFVVYDLKGFAAKTGREIDAQAKLLADLGKAPDWKLSGKYHLAGAYPQKWPPEETRR